MASADIDRDVRFAIANKRLLELTYTGSARVVEPHDYGVQKGLERLLVYQRRASNSPRGKSVTGWRLLEVAKIERCKVLDESFHGSRGKEHELHYDWEILYARVS